MRTAIIGGGIIGLGVAWRLAERGVDVVLYERRELGQGSTRAAAGMLAPLAEAVDGTVLPRAPRSEFLDAALRSRDLWQTWHRDLEERAGTRIEYDRSGTILLAFDDGQAASLDRLEAEALGRAEPAIRPETTTIERWIPDLGGRLEERLTAALLLAGEHRIHPVEVAAALAPAATRAGAELRPGHEVAGVQCLRRAVEITTAGGREAFDAVVVAGGAWSGSIAGLPRLPVHPVRGQMLQIEGVTWPWAGSLRVPGPMYAVRRRGDRLLVGATVEKVGFDDRTTEAGVRSLSDFVTEALPGVVLAGRTEAWSGLRPGTPDRLPLVGRLDERPIFYASGHLRNGILLAPWTAHEIERAVTDPLARDDESAFSPRRFIDAPRDTLEAAGTEVAPRL